MASTVPMDCPARSVLKGRLELQAAKVFRVLPDHQALTAKTVRTAYRGHRVQSARKASQATLVLPVQPVAREFQARQALPE